MGKSSSNNVITALLTAEEHHHYDNFFIAVSQKGTLLFQRFVNEIGACWYGQRQTCCSPAFVWAPPLANLPPPPRLSTLFNVVTARWGRRAGGVSVWRGWRGPGEARRGEAAGHHFHALLSKCCVYIAEGGPLCVPLQISRSKRGKHGYINKRRLLTALSLAPVTHLGFSSASEWREKVVYGSWVNSRRRRRVINSAFSHEKAT